VELPPDPVLTRQFLGLERRTARGGKDSVDHAPGGHDDLANAVAGLIGMLMTGGSRGEVFAEPSAFASEQVAERRLSLGLDDAPLPNWNA